MLFFFILLPLRQMSWMDFFSIHGCHEEMIKSMQVHLSDRRRKAYFRDITCQENTLPNEVIMLFIIGEYLFM